MTISDTLLICTRLADHWDNDRPFGNVQWCLEPARVPSGTGVSGVASTGRMPLAKPRWKNMPCDTMPRILRGSRLTTKRMLGLMGAGFIVGHPLRGPRLFADQRVEVGDAAGAGGLFGIVSDLLLALRFDAFERLQIVERHDAGRRLAHEDDASIVGLHQLPFRLFGIGQRRRQSVYFPGEAVETVQHQHLNSILGEQFVGALAARVCIFPVKRSKPSSTS